MRKAYRERLSFRALSLVLKLNPTWSMFFAAIVYLPFVAYGGVTVALIGFLIVIFGLLWLAGVPDSRQNEDGNWYRMDSDERAEWVFENRRFPKL